MSSEGGCAAATAAADAAATKDSEAYAVASAAQHTHLGGIASGGESMGAYHERQKTISFVRKPFPAIDSRRLKDITSYFRLQNTS